MKIADRNKIADMFLDWYNNWLTVKPFAAHYGLDERTANRVIELGCRVHEKRVKQLKGAGNE